MKDHLLNFRYIFSIILIASYSLGSLASAEDRWFDVELLVFKRNVDVNNVSEQLDQNDVYLKQVNRLEVFKAKPVTDCMTDKPCLHEKNPVQITNKQIVKGGHRLQRLDSSHLKLLKQRKSLDKHELFTPIMHTAWRMPIQNKRRALPIHLFAGENYALALHKEAILEQKEAKQKQTDIQSTTSNTVTDKASVSETEKLDVLDALLKQDTIQDLYEIDGNLLIYVERYLYVDSQLIVRTKTEKEIAAMKSVLANTTADGQDKGESTTASVEVVAQEAVVKNEVETETVITETLFDQDRRLRSEEIHYLDHPLFGIVIQIRKIPENK